MRKLVLVFVVGLGCARPEPESTAFVNVNLLPLDDDRVIAEQTVVVRDGKILSVGTPAPPGARIIDGRGKYLLPGFADMHTHLTREADLALYVAHGVTSVRNMWGAPAHLEWRERIKKGELLGPTIYTAGPIVDGEPPGHDGSLILLGPEDAERVVQLHQKMGYDFIKVYNGLSPPVFSRLMAAAQAAGLPVSGHVPRAVGLWNIGGMSSFEHLSGLKDALQGDPGKLPLLAQKLRERNVWSCPTRVVKVFYGLDAAQVRERLARPEMRWVPACDRAVWEPMPDDPAELEKARRMLALDDDAIGALRHAGARLLVGTDTGNPLVVPGWSFHEELQLLHAAGLRPREALRAATHDAAEFLRRADEFGSVQPGQRADLVLLDANPLVDLANSRRIAGVMVRGRWLPAAELSSLLAQVAAEVDGQRRSEGTLPADGQREFFGRYQATWRDAYFGGEKVLVEKLPDGRRRIHAEMFDPHQGQRVSVAVDEQRLLLDSDGAAGRGHIELRREGARAHIEGQLLSGVPASLDEELPPETLLGVEQSLTGHFLLLPRLAGLAVGQSLTVNRKELALGSAISIKASALELKRMADGKLPFKGAEVAVRRYQLGDGGLLAVDEQGFPLLLELPVYGATVKLTRIE